MRCYYEILEVHRNATDDKIKMSYRKLALRWHPDKNIDNPEEAKENFQLIKEAYNVLSDPDERAWYDDHRESILKDDKDQNHNDNSLNFNIYIFPSCFEGYGDNVNGFYTVYRTAFEKLVAEEAEFNKGDSDERIPSFGDSKSPRDDVLEFYDYWENYATKCPFASLQFHNIEDAPNRVARRLMEKENKKIRENARKERSRKIRWFTALARVRDKRLHDEAKLRQEKLKENKRKMKESIKQDMLDIQKKLKEQKESEWTELLNIELDLEENDAASEKEFAAKSNRRRKKKSKKPVFNDCDYDEKSVDLLTGLSKKQRRKQQEKILVDNLLENLQRELNENNKNTEENQVNPPSNGVDESSEKALCHLPERKKEEKRKNCGKRRATKRKRRKKGSYLRYLLSFLR